VRCASVRRSGQPRESLPFRPNEARFVHGVLEPHGQDQGNHSVVVVALPPEHEVLVLVVRGMTNGEIAAHLFLSAGTVKTHEKRIFAVILAYEVGLVRPGESAAE